MMDELSDEELMWAYIEGNLQAFEVLYRRLSPKVYGYLRSRVEGRDAVEDLFQKVFLKFHQSRDAYDPRYPVLQWLFVMTKSLILDQKKAEFRKDRLEKEYFDSHLSQTEAHPSLSPVMDENILGKLGPEAEGVVRLRVLDELSFTEISERLQKSEANVRQIFSRSIRKLRGLMKPGGKSS